MKMENVIDSAVWEDHHFWVGKNFNRLRMTPNIMLLPTCIGQFNLYPIFGFQVTIVGPRVGLTQSQVIFCQEHP